MVLLGSIRGHCFGPHKRDPWELFLDEADSRIDEVKRRLTVRLWEQPTQLEKATWLRDQEYCVQGKHHRPSHRLSISFEEFAFNAKASVENKESLNHASRSAVYQILLTLGAFPFSPDPGTRITWDSLLLAAGMLRERGQHVMASPGYTLPRNENDDPSGSRQRTRAAREQLRLLFQSLATEPPCRTLNRGHGVPDPNEDLLDALAVSMNLDDEDKILYYAEDFADVIAVLPSSRSDRKLDWVVAWKDLEVLLELMKFAVLSRRSSGHLDKEECSAIDDEVQRLMAAFQSHASSAGNGGITWRAFYETMECLGIVNSPEVEAADVVKGRAPRRDGITHLNAFMLRIFESLRLRFQETCSLCEEDDSDARYLTQGICN